MLPIRILTVDDAAQFVSLRRLALSTDPDAFSARPETDNNSKLDVVQQRLTTATADHGPFILGALDSSLVGVIGVIRASPTAAQLWGFYVKPEYRRAGIGRALVQQALRTARQIHGVRHVELGVGEANAAAALAYEQAGFQTVGTDLAAHTRSMRCEFDLESDA